MVGKMRWIDEFSGLDGMNAVTVLSGDRIRQCATSSGSRHFLLQAPQCPCSVRKRFSRDHCRRGRSKLSCRIVESHTRWELTTWADFQLYLHRLLMSTGCKSSYSGFLDVSRSNGGLRISGWIGQLSCMMIFSTSLSVAAFFRRAGCSMLESTGSHGRGVERRVAYVDIVLLANDECVIVYFRLRLIDMHFRHVR